MSETYLFRTLARVHIEKAREEPCSGDHFKHTNLATILPALPPHSLLLTDFFVLLLPQPPSSSSSFTKLQLHPHFIGSFRLAFSVERVARLVTTTGRVDAGEGCYQSVESKQLTVDFPASCCGNSTKRQIGHLCLQDPIQHEKSVSGSSVEDDSPPRDTDQIHPTSIEAGSQYPLSNHYVDAPVPTVPSANGAGDRDALSNVNTQTAYNGYDPLMTTGANFGQGGLHNINVSSDSHTLAADPFTDYIFRSLQQGKGSANLDTSVPENGTDVGQTPDWEQLLAAFTEPMPMPESSISWPPPDTGAVPPSAHLQIRNRRTSASSTQSSTQRNAIEPGLNDVQP